jgi:hypothetical protein
MADNRVLQSLKGKNNCTSFNQKFNIDQLTRLNDDVCYNSGELGQNNSINDYMLSNYASCDCNLTNVLDVSTENRGLTVKDGYGISECNINKDTELRHGTQKRRYKIDQQLFPRPFATTPFIAKGQYNPDLESRMLSSLQVVKHRQMQNVSEDNIYTPLTPNLADTVQDPVHIIQENVNTKWVSGGIPTRQAVKDFDYANRTNDNSTIKKLLMAKKQYLSF